MGKMLLALVLVLAIELSMVFFVTGGDSDQTSLMDFLLNMEDWSTTDFVGYLIGNLTILGGTAIIVGTFFTKQDWLWRAGMLVAYFFTFGSVIAGLYTFLNAGLAGYIAEPMGRQLVSISLVGPLILYFIMVSIDFVSGKD